MDSDTQSTLDYEPETNDSGESEGDDDSEHDETMKDDKLETSNEHLDDAEWTGFSDDAQDRWGRPIRNTFSTGSCLEGFGCICTSRPYFASYPLVRYVLLQQY